MRHRKSPVPNITVEEYYELIADTAYHLAMLQGFKMVNLKSDWQLVEKRILNVISNACEQYDGNTRLHKVVNSDLKKDRV